MKTLQISGTTAALAWLVLSLLALPAFIVIPVSFTDTRYLSLPEEGLSLQHWRTFLTSREWLSSIWQMSWGWMPGTSKEITGIRLCNPAGPTIRARPGRPSSTRCVSRISWPEIADQSSVISHSTAAPSPIASPIGGVPASNLCGGAA